jgi:hypothetical protein
MPDNIKLEKIMSQYTKTLIETSFGELPENYYGVAVDIYKSSYGNICHISILFKNPMTKDEMDYFDRQSRLNVTREATKVFPPDLINAHITSSLTTLDTYNNKTKLFYNKNK